MDAIDIVKAYIKEHKEYDGLVSRSGNCGCSGEEYPYFSCCFDGDGNGEHCLAAHFEIVPCNYVDGKCSVGNNAEVSREPHSKDDMSDLLTWVQSDDGLHKVFVKGPRRVLVR